MKNKGQALVEFVILIPIVLMIIFVVIDFSNIFYQKNHLEGTISEVVSYKENGKSNSFVKSKIPSDVSVSYKKSDNMLKITVSKSINLVTPFSSAIFDNPYPISTDRTIIYE